MAIPAVVKARIPALAWLPAYERRWLQPDIIAGVTTASVIIPKAMAYATLAGLAVQTGLYTALLPMLVYAFLGDSRRLSVSTTTTLGILTAAEIGHLASGGSPAQMAAIATTLSVLVGVILLLTSTLRLGFVAQFISEPVLTGFKAGIGLVIVADQAPKLFGLHIHKVSFLQGILATIQALPGTSVVTLALSLATIGLMVVLHRLAPRVPAPLAAVALGIGASGLLGLKARGVDTIGAITSGLPAFTPPHVDLLVALWPAALGIALMSFTESIAAGRAFAQPGERRPDANQELLALGAANLAGGLFAAMPSGGGTSQTAVNARAGARTPVASLVTAATTAAVVLFLAPLIELMPQATLAAVVIVTSLPLIDPRRLRRDSRRADGRVPLGRGRDARRHRPRDASGHSRGGDPVDGHRCCVRPTILPSTCSAASRARTISVRCATTARTTRSSRACWCCDPKGGFTSRTRSASWTRSWRTCRRRKLPW